MKVLFKILLLLLIASCTKSQPTVTINDGSPSVSINGGGTSSISIDNQAFYPPETGDITFGDEDFWFSIPGYAGTGYTARSTAGYVEFKTTETAFDVKVGGNWSTASSSFDSQSEIQVLVDGVYNQSVTLTADNTTQTYAITVPAGDKLIRIVNGYTANGNSLTLPNAGVFLQGVVTTGPIRVKIPTTPLHKRLFVGNSITTGADSDHPSIIGFPGLFRSQSNWEVQVDSWGARRLLTTTSGNGATMAAFLSDEMNGSATNELFMFLGTNNFGLVGGQSKATFKTEYQYFLDELHYLTHL